MKIRTLLLSLVAFACIMPSNSQTVYNKFATDDINDLALIYIGGRHRPAWNKNLFKPYVVHTYPDGHKSWMFDGFLMIEFMTQDESGKQSVSFGEYNAACATKEDWEWLLEQQLGTSSGLGCKALDELIEELKSELGTPNHKHKVVLTVPIPNQATLVWGRLDGVALNFANIDDKVKAMKWFADYMKDKWAEANFKNLDLEGVYWVSETMGNGNDQLAKRMNAYYHSVGLKSYWIPYFKATGRTQWEELGFSIAYTQPNYYFRTTVPIEQLQDAIGDSNVYGLGLEMEFEGYNFSYAGPGRPLNRITPSNCGLYGNSPEFYQRLVDYIDWFEAYGVFDSSAISYYSGFQGVYDFENSGHPKDKELMNRLAEHLQRRHVEAGWHKDPAGVDNIAVPDYKIAYAVEGGIYIADNAGNDVKVFNIDGRLVYSRDNAAADGVDRLHYGITVNCRPGIYIVSSPVKSVKVIVK